MRERFLAGPDAGQRETEKDASRFQFTDVAVPRPYDDFLVPRMFEPCA